MAVTRRTYAGAGIRTTLTAGISNVDTSISIAAGTGWKSGVTPFFVVVDPNTATEEKILVTRSGLVLTVSGSRGADETTAVSHSAGAVIYPCLSALELDEANRLAAAMTTEGDIIVADASGNPIRLARGTTGQVLEATASTVAWGQTDTAGIADAAVTAAKFASEAWTAFTPTLVQLGAVTKNSDCAYVKHGRLVIARYRLACTGSGTGGNAVEIGLPFTSTGVSDQLLGGPFRLEDSSASLKYFGAPFLNTSLSSFLLDSMQSTSTAIDTFLGVSGFTAALASGDLITGIVTFEATT